MTLYGTSHVLHFDQQYVMDHAIADPSGRIICWDPPQSEGYYECYFEALEDNYGLQEKWSLEFDIDIGAIADNNEAHGRIRGKNRHNTLLDYGKLQGANPNPAEAIRTAKAVKVATVGLHETIAGLEKEIHHVRPKVGRDQEELSQERIHDRDESEHYQWNNQPNNYNSSQFLQSVSWNTNLVVRYLATKPDPTW